MGRISLALLSPVTWLLICTASLTLAEENHDTREGEDVTLQCRFQPQPPAAESLTYYWVRTTPNMHDNVAINNVPLQINYQLSYMPHEGRYDLLISNATYERDNGRFECRVKAGGSGRTLHAQAHQLVVLTPPRAPLVSPASRASAQEGREIKLTCSSSGGSPEPSIRWFREGSNHPLEAAITSGKSRAEATVATLTLMPTKEDDGALFRCMVWNRALPEGGQLEASVSLNVNYFPRVEIGPENPLRVEVDGSATMECTVDAKPKVTNVHWTRNGKIISNSFTFTVQGVTEEDAGKYTCSADNGLGRIGEKDIYLDILYPPTVTVESKTHEVDESGTVEINCVVHANPEPKLVEWTKEGKADFKRSGRVLQLHHVTADDAGTYVCSATNLIATTNGKLAERMGTASVAVLVRHVPGRARISPDRPIAQEGAGVTLTCSASPPGWPAPQYRWFRDTDPQTTTRTVLATGNKYTIPGAHLGSEGTYHCQATNELGHGDMASVTLEVHQPPKIQTRLQTHMIKRAGDEDYFIACTANGKPKPSVKWMKDGVEISLDKNLYEIKTDVVEERSGVVNVHTTLKFSGKSRTGLNHLIPDDRGVYSCVFENEVKKVESTMHLRIEHQPIAIRQPSKVAFDIGETAEITCRIQAYPKPEFQWYYGSNTAALQMSSDGHYEINTTTNNNDSYLTKLIIRNIRPQDYGEYYCKAKNSLGSIRPQIKLQPKGAPETPRNLQASDIGASYVTLNWEPGFDGGLSNTKYFVHYRREATPSSDVVAQECASMLERTGDWMEFDCGRKVPCNITGLDQHQNYMYKVKALNTKGQSNYSTELSKTTKVDKIPPPESVTYDPSSKSLAFSVAPTCLSLIGVAEWLVDGRTVLATWQVVDNIPLRLSGTSPTFHESVIDNLVTSSKMVRNSGRSFAENSVTQVDELNPRVRVKLCLRINQDHCSEYSEAEIGPAYIKEASALTTPTLIAIVVSCLVFLLFLSLLFIFCRCKRNENKKQGKDYERDSVRPSMVAAQNQAPPPYYPSNGMENKALEHSMDLALMDDSKNVYATQGGYGYHVSPNVQGHPGQNISNADWVNMGYIENSYPNSNNGGSVNSQDSLWQMKMAGVPNPSAQMAPHQIMDRQSNYGYDPITHGGYGAIDDYAPYPQMTHPNQASVQDNFNMRGSQNPSRQEYCSDPYASVHKPKKRVDQHIESPYHEVSGLPEPYMEQMCEGDNEKPPHLSLSYDESLESGYSTPNSRTRRVIREIIV